MLIITSIIHFYGSAQKATSRKGGLVQQTIKSPLDMIKSKRDKLAESIRKDNRNSIPSINPKKSDKRNNLDNNSVY